MREPRPLSSVRLHHHHHRPPEHRPLSSIAPGRRVQNHRRPPDRRRLRAVEPSCRQIHPHWFCMMGGSRRFLRRITSGCPRPCSGRRRRGRPSLILRNSTGCGTIHLPLPRAYPALLVRTGTLPPVYWCGCRGVCGPSSCTALSRPATTKPSYPRERTHASGRSPTSTDTTAWRLSIYIVPPAIGA